MVLNQSPLVEAVFEVGFKRDIIEFDPTLAGLFYSKIKDEFNHKKEIPNVEFEITDEDGVERKINSTLTRFNNDLGYYIQLTNDYIVFNKTKPNINWLALKDNILDKLGLYVDINKNQNISICSLKYLNVIEIPIGQKFEDNFSFALPIPLGQNYQSIQGFTSFVDFEVNGLLAKLKVRSLMPKDKTTNQVLMEITMSTTESFEYDNTYISDFLKKAHDLICDVFKDSLTQTLYEKYEKSN